MGALIGTVAVCATAAGAVAADADAAATAPKPASRTVAPAVAVSLVRRLFMVSNSSSYAARDARTLQKVLQDQPGARTVLRCSVERVRVAIVPEHFLMGRQYVFDLGLWTIY
jgi:hypothetical protein